MGAFRHIERHTEDFLPCRAAGEADVVHPEGASERGALIPHQPLDRINIGGIKVFHHCLVFHLHVGDELVIGQQFLPGPGQILVGGDHRQQRTDAEIALDDQIAADQIEEERRQLVHEIIHELDEILPIVDLVADLEIFVEPVSNIGRMQRRSIIGVNLMNASDRLAQLVGNDANVLDPLAGEQDNLLLQLGNDIGLQRIGADGGKPQQRVLHEDEADLHHQKAALIGRQRNGIADEAADILHLGGDHGDDLAGTHLPEMRKAESEHTLKKLEAQAAQHALAQPSLVDVDPELQPVADDNEGKKRDAEQEKIGDLIKFKSLHFPWETVALHSIVDDLLGKLQQDVADRVRQDREKKNEELLPRTELPDEAKKAFFHSEVQSGETAAILVLV